LFFAQLDLVIAALTAAGHSTAVLPGSEITPLDRAFIGVAPFSLEKELHGFPTAQLATGFSISRHQTSSN